VVAAPVNPLFPEEKLAVEGLPSPQFPCLLHCALSPSPFSRSPVGTTTTELLDRLLPRMIPFPMVSFVVSAVALPVKYLLRSRVVLFLYACALRETLLRMCKWSCTTSRGSLPPTSSIAAQYRVGLCLGRLADEDTRLLLRLLLC